MARIEPGVEFDKEENHEKLTERMQNLSNKQYTLRIPENLYMAVKLKLVKEKKKLRPVLIDMLEKYIKTS
jgi:hypothetical protein